MISALAIDNFQSHKCSSLEFSPGINALTGNSDCGKSAVLRALCWAVLNSPSGDAHISDWAKTAKGGIKADKECAVTIYGDDGTRVQRLRSATFNGYVVDSPDGSTMEFEALRTDVPKQVKDALNLGEVNIQKQMDGPFLLSMTAGEVARYINTLVDLTKIDEYQTAINSILRSTNGLIKATQDEVDRAQASVDALSWVPEAEKLVDEFIQLEKKSAAMTAEMKTLADQIVSHGFYSAQVKNADDALTEILPSLERMKQCWEEEHTKRAEIRKLSDDLQRHQECLETAKLFPEGIYGELLKITGLMTEIGEKKYKIQELGASLTKYGELLEAARAYPETLDEGLQRLARLDKIVRNSAEAINSLGESLKRHEKLCMECMHDSEELDGIRLTLSTMACPLCGHVGCESIH